VTVAEAIREHLMSLAPVVALVGTRVRLVKLRQSEPTFPVIRVQRIDENQGMHLRGGGVKVARVQVDSIAKEGSGVDAYSVATAVDAAVAGPGDGTGLIGYRGDVGSPAFRIHAILPLPVREGYDADELQQFKVMRDVEVHFTD
jgi:hypothetical protein